MRMGAIPAMVLAIFAISPLSAAEIVPHEATFTLILEKYNGPGELRSWNGSTRYSISRDCQKWKQKTEMEYGFAINGTRSEIRSIFTHYEALDGSRFEFDARLLVDGETMEHWKGSARLQGRGKPGIVTYRAPTRETLDLPAGTIFPIASRLASIDHLRAGRTEWKQLFFNGELSDKSYSVRKRGVATPTSPAGDTNLISQVGWLVEKTTYVTQSGMTVKGTDLMHANGAISLMMHDNPMLRMRGEIVEIKALSAPQC